MLPAGRYFVRVEKPGYRSGDPVTGEPLEIAPGMKSPVLRLEPLAKIVGRVTDTYGEPLPRAAIRLYGSRVDEGLRAPFRSRSVSTDGGGYFRLWNLEPGEYYLVAAGRGGGTASYVGHVEASAPNSHESFEAVYYGGARDRASATPVVLAAGRQIEANFRVAMRPAYRVRGTIRNGRPYQPIEVELLRGGMEASATRALVNAQTGSFEAQDVVPGAYTLRASQTRSGEPLRAEREIEVGEGDLGGIALDLVSQIEIPVRVEVRGGADRWRRCAIRLDGADGTRVDSSSDPDRAVKLRAFPGSYRLRIAAIGSYVSSARSGNVDLLATGTLVVAPGALPLEIVLGMDGGFINGTVADGETGSAVVLVRLNDGVSEMSPATAGSFSFGPVAPGDYEAHLLRNAEAFEYRNPAAIRALGRGVAVRVEPRANVRLELKEAK
jgi:hypothetical protein